MAEKNHSNKSISENNKTQQAPEKQDMKEKKHGKEKSFRHARLLCIWQKHLPKTL